MAAAASQLCVRQASTLLDCFIHHKGCKVEQISPLFTYISTSFSSSEERPCQPGMPSTVQISIYTEYGSRLMANQGGEVNLSDFVVAFKFIYLKYIYTREKLLLAKSAKQSEGKGVSRTNSNVKQLLH